MQNPPTPNYGNPQQFPPPPGQQQVPPQHSFAQQQFPGRPPFQPQQSQPGFQRPPAPVPHGSMQQNFQRPPFNPQQQGQPPMQPGPFPPRPGYSPNMSPMTTHRPPPPSNLQANQSPRPPAMGLNRTPSNVRPPMASSSSTPQMLHSNLSASSLPPPNTPPMMNGGPPPQGQMGGPQPMPHQQQPLSGPPMPNQLPPPPQLNQVDNLSSQMDAIGIQKTSPRTKRVYHNAGAPVNPQNPPTQFPQQVYPPVNGPSTQQYPTGQTGVVPPPGQPFPANHQPQLRPPLPHQPISQSSMQDSSGYPSRTSSQSNLAPPKSRIDPDQIPSPIAVHGADREAHTGTPYRCMSKGVPPLASTDFIAIDDGNCNPRFKRMTTYNIPCTDELANNSLVPMGMIVQPLADLGYGENPIPVVDFGEQGPVRCGRCRGYINVFVMFTDGGRKFTCNLCQFENTVAPEYFANLDMNGRRVDIDRHPELMFGTVEFVATKEYCARPPEPASYIFAIDVSWTAVQSGMLRTAVEALKNFLYGNPERGGLPPSCRIGIMTYDSTIHFYNLRSNLEQPLMLVVCDIAEVFVPLSEGLLVDPVESRTVIENLLDSLPTMFENNRATQPVLGALVQAATLALKQKGGKLSIFHTVLPTTGPGALKPREDPKILGTDKEKSLYEPAEYFWRKSAVDCTQSGVSIDLYLFPNNAYVDVASIGSLSTLTGGDCYMYPGFDYARDANKFGNDLKKNLSRFFGYDALLRIRCSNGLKITDHHGNFYMKNTTDVELAGIDSRKAIAVTIKHDGKIDDSRTPDAFFQTALLYTTATGERRIRVHNLAVPVTSSMANIFRMADMDTTINYFAKLAIAQTVTASLKQVREQLSEKCVKVLSAYRRHVASSTGPGQLILPEAYKLYPLFTLSLLKTRAFRGGPEMSTDVRVNNFRMLKSMSIGDSIPFFYPVLFGIHDMAPEAGTINEYSGQVILPDAIRVSYERLDRSGIYILENGQQMFVWIGSQTPAELLRIIFGQDALEQIDVKMRNLPELDNPFSQRVHRIMNHIQTIRPRYLQMQIVRHQIDAFLETEFMNLLVEDKNNDAMSYMDFLVFTHKNIQMEITSN
ncbi:Protein transport protein Sec24C [Nowakowskiella sp. JEL0407]|nr:Protein transport protein Sec24C [Nowakowskiella sp. JEL0407]